MYCSNCGTKASGNFCSQCGARIRTEQANLVLQSIETEPYEWETDSDFENIVQVKAVRHAIAQNASKAVKGISAEAIFALYDKILSSPIPMERLAAVIQPLYDSWGVRTGKERVELLLAPIGWVIAQTLCSFAKNAQAFQSAISIEYGCLLIAELPSSICSMKGTLQVKLILQGNRTRVEASTIIPGQAFDWGKSTRCLEHYITDLNSDLGLPKRDQAAA